MQKQVFAVTQKAHPPAQVHVFAVSGQRALMILRQVVQVMPMRTESFIYIFFLIYQASLMFSDINDEEPAAKVSFS